MKTSLAASLLVTLAVCIGYVGVALGISKSDERLLADRSSELRGVALVRFRRAFVGQAIAMVLLVLWLLSQGWSLSRLGLTSPGEPAGWVAAVVVVALFATALLRGPLRGVAVPTEWSAFRVYGTTVCVVVGAFEEIVFRGFAMTELAAGGLNPLLQVIAGALLWSLGHFRWGRRPEGYDWRLVLGALGNTFILGLAFGTVYLLGGRSLWPAIAAHSGLNVFIEPWLILPNMQSNSESGR